MYEYKIDQRLSILDMADDLNTFVETVREKTGSDKFIFYSRSMGPALLYAYLYKYQKPKNYSDVESVLLSMSTAPSNPTAEAIFGGRVELDGESANRIISMYQKDVDSVIGGTDYAELLESALEVLRTQYGIEMTADVVQRVYDQLKDRLIAKIIKAYWGRMPGYWAQVYNGFDEAVDYVFAEPGDKEKFAPLIADIKEYHDTVAVNAIPMIKEIGALGKPVYVTADYGWQQFPLSEEARYVGDGTIGLRQQTFGATVSEVGGALSDEYVKQQTEKGLAKYISPDRQVDLSTALFPDRTWVFKNNNHEWWGDVPIVELEIMRSGGATADTLGKYSRFMNLVGDERDAVPAEAENENDIDWNVEAGQSPFKAIGSLMKKIFSFFKTIMAFLRNALLAKIKG